MKSFLIHFSLFVLLYMALITIGLFITRITQPQNLHFALIDKHNRLNKVKSPRVIFVGGSNLSFGINSKEIQEQLHINVINTSVHAGMGLKYIIEDIIPYIKKGDIVILAAEYSQFFGNDMYGQEPMISSIIALPNTFHLFNWQNWKPILSSLPERAFKNILKYFITLYSRIMGIENKGVYDRSSFNEFGDAVAHYGKPYEIFDPNYTISGNFNKEMNTLFLKLKHVVEKRRGKILYAYPSLMQKSFNSIKDQVDQISEEIINIGIDTLGAPNKYSFADSLYFNSPYHLTKSGVDLRTQLLINDLKKHLH